MRRYLVAGLMLVGLAVAGSAGAAGAGGYPPTTIPPPPTTTPPTSTPPTSTPPTSVPPTAPPTAVCTVSLSATGGGTLTVTGTGFVPGSVLEIFFESTPVLVATTTADANGRFTVTFALPAGTEPGTHTVRVGGTSCPIEIGGGGAGLAFTGSDTRTIVLGGLAVIGIGLVLYVAGRRRASARSTLR
jgi:hypothetical protein